MTHCTIGDVGFHSKLRRVVGITADFNFCRNEWFFLCSLTHSISANNKQQCKHSHDLVSALETDDGNWNGCKYKNEFYDHKSFNRSKQEKQPYACHQESETDDHFQHLCCAYELVKCRNAAEKQYCFDKVYQQENNYDDKMNCCEEG